MTVYIDTSPDLKHYGVMGMKWGVRKDGMPQGYQGSGKAKVEKNTVFPKKATQGTWQDDMASVNPKKGHSNCVYCTTAYDLRRRGYDVTAGKTPIGTSEAVVTELYKGSKVETVKPAKYSNSSWADYDLYRADGADAYRQAKKDHAAQVEKTLADQGEGARGNLLVTWEGCHGAHSIAYEVIDGKVQIIDGQVSRSQTVESLMMNVSPTKDVSYVRTDNCEPDLKKMAELGIIKGEGLKAQKGHTRNERKQIMKELREENKKISDKSDMEAANKAHEKVEKKHSATKVHEVMRSQQKIDNAKAAAAGILTYVGLIAVFALPVIMDNR